MATDKGSLAWRVRLWLERLVTPTVRRRLDDIEQRMASSDSQLHIIESRLSALDGGMTALASRADALEAEPAAWRQRLTVLERCLGLEGLSAEEKVPDGLERLLEMRLGQLEVRLLSYLEGPYFERVGGASAPPSEAAVVSRGAHSLTAIAGSVAGLQQAVDGRLAQIERRLASPDISAPNAPAVEGDQSAARAIEGVGSTMADVQRLLQQVETRLAEPGNAAPPPQQWEFVIATLTTLEADARRQEKLALLEGRATLALSDKRASRVEYPAVVAPAKVDLDAQLDALRERAPLNFDAWLERFRAGETEYNKRDANSLSTREHPQAFNFRLFVAVHAKGRVLDIGVGPLAVPSYLADVPLAQLAGIDPLAPFEPHPFAFTRSLAESIPWPDESFETVVIATALDHVYLLDVALQEVDRVLAQGGRLLVWTGIFAETPAYDPYAAVIDPPDAFHLFHPGENWLPEFIEKRFKLVERVDTSVVGYANALLAYEKKS